MIDANVVQQVIAFLRGRLDQPLTLEEVSKSMGYSSSWLRSAFKKHTGQSLIAFHLQARLSKARELLQQTGLSVSEIAIETGYQSYTHFAHSFHKHVGISPTQYRDQARAQFPVPESFEEKNPGLAKSPRWLADDFSQEKIAPWWKMIAGKWRQENGILHGKSSIGLGLGITKPLPENFRITFDVLLSREGDARRSDFNISLRDESLHHVFLAFVLGARENTTGLLARATIMALTSTLQENSAAVLKCDTWQQIQVELRGSTWRLSIGDQEMFVFEETFSPLYKWRCRFAFNSSRSAVSLRNLRILDLGFSTLVPVIGQGDALFQAGSFDQARDFYFRLLQSEGSLECHPELHYKIGMCLLHRALYGEGRNWINRALLLPKAGPWKGRAKLALLEADWHQNQWGELEQNARLLLKEKQMVLPVNELLERVCLNLGDRGFYAMAIDFYQVILDQNSRETVRTGNFIAEMLLALGRFAESEKMLRDSLEKEKASMEYCLYTRFSIADALVFQGKHKESMELITHLKTLDNNPLHLARCQIYEALAIQGLGDLEQSVTLLRTVKDQFSQAAEFAARACLMAVWPMCVLGKTTQAHALIETARILSPQSGYLTISTRSRYLYLPLLCEGRHLEAAEMFLQDSRDEDNRIATHAEQAVMAGILFELAGEKEKAAAVWIDTAKRYPPDRCCFFGTLARNLCAGGDVHIEDMPFHPQKRSEMSYLIGLLYESRGDNLRSQTLFKLSAQEDLSQRWPSQMARQKISQPS